MLQARVHYEHEKKKRHDIQHLGQGWVDFRSLFEGKIGNCILYNI